MTVKRENWKGHYFVVDRDSRGHFLSWRKWKRSDPSTWVKKPPEKKVEEPVVVGCWVRCSISCNTKESPKWGGRTYKLDATATCFGSKADCVRMLQKGMNKECKTPLPKTVYTNTDYWGYDKGEGWSYLPNSAMDIPVRFEFPDPNLERVVEGAEVRSCR